MRESADLGLTRRLETGRIALEMTVPHDLGQTRQRRARLAFVSRYDASDHNAHSGAAFSMRRELSKRFDVVDCFPVHVFQEKLFLPVKAVYKARGQYYEREREPQILKSMARVIEARLKAAKPDVVFSPSSIPMTYVDTVLPVVWSADLLFPAYIATYIPNPARRSFELGLRQEALALDRASRVSFPSDWAAAEAVSRYGTPREKIAVIPWGANLGHDIDIESVRTGIAGRPGGECRIVFVGKDWKRKGGDLVVDTVRRLNDRGLPTSLTIVGCTPDIPPEPWIRVHPFLDKADPEGWKTFCRLMHQAHFFFMPSRAEASPHALCEASAFGTPSISSTEGGIPTIVRDGVTGYTRPRDSDPEVFAELIAQAMADRPAYLAMCEAARLDYEDRLNWDQFGRRLSEVLYERL